MTAWAAEPVRAVASSRRPGFFPTLLDAVRGRPEKGDGQALSPEQIEALGALFAPAYGITVEAAAAELARVRIYVGGAAADRGGQTVTLGADVYVLDAARVAYIAGWQGRRLLAHELGHTMQCLTVPGWEAAMLGGGRNGRLRAAALNYGIGVVASTAVIRGVAKWIGDRVRPGRRSRRRSIDRDVHDFLPLEIDAERHAREFIALTERKPPPPQ